ncbi:DUF4347 domain-containing protein [Prosthecochloris vibrioformis]
MLSTIVFIDSRIADRNRILAQFDATTRYVILDEQQDGILQIAEALSGSSGYDAVQIFSHGSPGSLLLGNTTFDSAALERYAAELAIIGNALTAEGDILLYGCNVGAGDEGRAFVDQLAAATGADVAASDDMTGAAQKGGDWELEVVSGEVDEREIVETEGYSGVLAESVIIGNSDNNSLPGTENDDTIYGYEGNDTLDGGAGNDCLIGGYHADTIIGGTGDDRILFDRDDTSVDGGEGSDALLLERDYDFEEIAAHATNIEAVVLTRERHWIDDVNVQDIISLTTGSVGGVLYFRIDDDAPENPEYTIELQDGEGWHDTGNDVTEGTGEFQLTFDVFVDMDSSAVVVVQQGIDVEYDRYDVIGTSGNDVIDGEYGGRTSDNPEIIAGFGGNDTIDAGAGNDFVWAGEGDDSVNGDADDDLLWAGGGHDTINGNEGNDFIGAASGTLTATGGAGADVFGLLEPDSGFDLNALPVITVTDFTIAEDRVFFNPLVEYAAQGYTGGNPMHPDLGYIVLEQNGNDSLIRFDADGATGSGTAETIMILQNVTAASLTSSEFLNAFTTIEDDDIPTSVSYSTSGIDPNPTDTVVAGATDLVGTDGYNFFWGGFGNDSFAGGSGSDNLEGKYGDDTLDGGDGDDELNGGPGNDSLVGGTGNDSYEIPLDGTHDVIRDTGGNEDRIDIEIDGNQAMWFGDAIYENGDVLFTAVSSYQDAPDNLIITRLTVEDVDAGGLVERIDIEFEDNCACLSVSTGPTGSDDQNDLIVAVQSGTTIEGLDRDDYLFGSEGSDTLDGGDGNDFLNGHDGADQLIGGAGNDTLHGNAGDDSVDGGTGNDTVVYIGAQSEYTITYDSASDSYTVTDTVADRDGVDTVTGVEHFVFNDGTDSIPEAVSFDPANGSGDAAVTDPIAITFSEDVVAGSGSIELSDGDGVVESFDVASSSQLSIDGTALTITPSSVLQPGTTYQVSFDNGTLLDIEGFAYDPEADTYEFTTAEAGHNVNGGVVFWKTGDALDGVKMSITSQPDSGTPSPVELRTVSIHEDGGREIEIWLDTERTDIDSLQLEFSLDDGALATGWQDADGLPANWNSIPNTEDAGLFILGGFSLTALSSGQVKLGTLSASAPANSDQFSMSLESGALGEEELQPFAYHEQQTTIESDGTYSFEAIAEGWYALDGDKEVDSSLYTAVKATDALAALKIAVAMNPNNDGSEVEPWQYLAADVDQDGDVQATDALAILKMAVKMDDAPDPEWLIMPESAGDQEMSRTEVIWPDAPEYLVNQDMEVDFVGIVKGDVDGSWMPSVPLPA